MSLFLFARNSDDDCENTFGKNSPRCQKPVSTQALPIALGVCLPVACAILVCCFLHWRHIRRLKKEDDETKDLNADIDMDEMDQQHLTNSDEKASDHNNDAKKLNRISGWGIARPPQYPSSRTPSMVSSNHPDNPFHSSEIYLLHPDMASSRTSLEEYSKSIYDGNAYPSIRSPNAYPPSMRGSQYSRSPSETNIPRLRHHLQQEVTPVNITENKSNGSPALSVRSIADTHDSQSDENTYEDARDTDNEAERTKFHTGPPSRDISSSSDLSYASGASHLDNGETSISTPTSSSMSPINYQHQRYSSAGVKQQSPGFVEPQSYDESRNEIDESEHKSDDEMGKDDDDMSIQESLSSGSSRSASPELSIRHENRNSGDYSRNLTEPELHESSANQLNEIDNVEINEKRNTIESDTCLDREDSSVDVTRSDTKHFERVKSFYREYMDSKEVEEEEEPKEEPKDNVPDENMADSSLTQSYDEPSYEEPSYDEPPYDETSHFENQYIERPLPTKRSLSTERSLTSERPLPTENVQSANYPQNYDEQNYYDDDGAESFYGDADDYNAPRYSVAPLGNMERPYSEYTGYPVQSKHRTIAPLRTAIRHMQPYSSQPVSPISSSRPAPPPPRPLPALKSLPSPSSLGDGDMVNFAPKVRRKPKTHGPGSPVSPQMGSRTASGLSMRDLVPEKGDLNGRRAAEARPDSMLVPGTDDSLMLRPHMSIR